MNGVATLTNELGRDATTLGELPGPLAIFVLDDGKHLRDSHPPGMQAEHELVGKWEPDRSKSGSQ
jgi:hypothetical protein